MTQNSWQPKLGVLLATLLLAAAANACSSDPDTSSGDDDDDGQSSSGSGQTGSSGASSTITTAECTSRCKIRVEACQVPAAQQDSTCKTLCGGTLNDDQLTCIEALPCSSDQTDIQDCVDANPGASSSSGGSSGGGAAPTSGDSCKCNGSTCLGTSREYCAGIGKDPELYCVMLSRESGTCAARCKDENDDSCPSGTSCSDAGKDPVTTGDFGFYCL